jgi:hypothetical protein
MAFLLFVATVGVWVRSYFVADDVRLAAPEFPAGEYHYRYALSVWRGRLIVSWVRNVTAYTPPLVYCSWESMTAEWEPYGDGQFKPGETRLGIGVTTFETGRGGTQSGSEEQDREWDVRLPMWPLAAICGVPAAVWIWGVWRRTRGTAAARLGLCPGCGYDLRASSDRCPECGRPIAAPGSIAQSSWGRELRPLVVATVLLVTMAVVAGWSGYARVEHSRLAWAEHDRLEKAKAAAWDAIARGDAAALEAAFRAGAVIAPAEAGETMLRAIDNVSPDIARVLVEHGADLTLEKGRALADAMRLGEMELARCLVEHGADVRAMGAFSDPPMNLAVDSCRTTAELELVRRLLERGADPNGRTEGGMTPLTELMARGEPTENGQAFLALLLAHGADVNIRDSQGLTPLGRIEAMPESDWQRDLAAFLRSRGAKP